MADIEQLVAELADGAARVKPAPHPYQLSLKWMGAATAYLTVSLAISGLRPDLVQALQRPWFIAEIVALLLVFVATSFSAALLAFPDLHQKRSLVFAPAWMFALFLVVILFAWHADSPPAPLPVHSFECTLSITLVSLLPAVWTFYAIRKYASTNYYWAGSIALLSAFSVGALWLRLHEVNDSILHVVEWHYLPMIAASILGLWLGKVLLKW
ncbi:MAG TPA: DUF1109 domain-containing protein [Gallionellaceae bacterium]|nr:DUF1109 domain-containing protein [Gallionellaceae bacterium]